jgi:hypothetical protein
MHGYYAEDKVVRPVVGDSLSPIEATALTLHGPQEVLA